MATHGTITVGISWERLPWKEMNDLFLGVIVELSQVDIELYFQEQLSYLSRKYSWNDPWIRSAGNPWPEYSCVDLPGAPGNCRDSRGSGFQG